MLAGRWGVNDTVFMPPARTIYIKIASSIAAAFIWCISTAFTSAQSTDPNPQEQVMQQMRQQIGLDSASANAKKPDGLRIQFSKIGEVDLPDGHFMRYRMLVPGAPEKQSFVMAIWRIGSPVRYSHKPLYVNAKGLVMTHLPLPEQEGKEAADKADEVEVDLKAARGEPIRYMLASPDGKLFYSGTIVVHPIESKDGNCRLEARLGLPAGQTVLVYVDGLLPNVQVPLQSISEGESHIPMLSSDSHGHAVSIVAPYVTGKEAGVVKMAVASAGCSVSVEVPWGKGSYHSF